MSMSKNDLEDLMGNKIKIDTFVSKMGRDQDILTISFKVSYKEPAEELVDFFEKGYDWILDADVSTGTVRDGSWLVFIETLRRPSLASKFAGLLKDMKNLNGIDPKDYIFKYRHQNDYYVFTEENFEKYVPLSPRAYNKHLRQEQLDEENLRTIAGLPIKTNTVLDRETHDYVHLSKYGSLTETNNLITSRNILSLGISPYELSTLMKEYRAEQLTYNEIGNNAMVTFYSPQEKEDFEKFLKRRGIKYKEVGDE